ncbi:SGNH/GDSL hydrolase family protein [Streptomyces yaizuensis]|uniref:SGNH/GDSL hydrolase family protein n=1 Tax=Streptomyces yaizuensis TaxID=2989713 RepID=A0ABQ5NSG3_9ACTN|nr:SGNH/GDSL hydrolase family protein [Streptomyces sp. YSPA8]GLF93083.1 SGNH/GDSL hydrolase family protein [Streptomyces sp. YSPA8]
MRIHRRTAWLGTALLIGALATPMARAVDAPDARGAVSTAAGPLPGKAAARVTPAAPAAGEQLITFSEFPVDTAITRQYRPRGVVFSGTGGGGTPFISPDGANPTAPALSGSPRFQGGIRGDFVKVGGAPRTVGTFSLDVGYIDDPDSVAVTAHDAKGKQLARKLADRRGMVRITLTAKGITSFRVQQVAGESAGFAVDNLRYPRPELLAALGDSYSSGEANPPYVKGTDVKGKGCHRSQKAWPVLLGKNNTAVSRVKHLACSGARTTALTQSYNGEIPQLTALGRLTGKDEPAVVTVTLGGNDVGFGTVLEACYVFWGKCLGRDGAVAKAEKELATLGGRLKNHYLSIQRKAPNATMVVVGYPRLFPATDREENCAWLSNDERKALNALGTKVDGVLAARAKEAGLAYVTVQETTAGHELCTRNESWFFPVGLTGGQQRAHPVLKGQQAIEAKVRRHIDTLLKR